MPPSPVYDLVIDKPMTREDCAKAFHSYPTYEQLYMACMTSGEIAKAEEPIQIPPSNPFRDSGQP